MENKATHDPLLTPAEASDYLRVAEGTIRNMASAGEIPKVKVGKLLRFRRSDLNAWIEARAQPAAN